MKRESPKKDFAYFLLYMFSFLLLWEWLRPLKELTDTSNLEVFLVFLFLSLVMSFFSLSTIPSTSVKMIFILYSIHFMYFDGTFFSSGWFKQFIENMVANSTLIWESKWADMTNDFRTVLFFLLLWLMSYLIEYWLIHKKQIFLFFFMTLIYITVLDTFTPYAANVAIIRTVIVGFAVMGMLAYFRISERELTRSKADSARKWMIPLLAMILLSAGIGYAAPKADPVWPDPVPFLKSYGKGNGGGGVKKIGYGTDDSRLGGSFIGDDTVVFEAEADKRHYWRIETKDTYTGKGWVADKDGSPPVWFEPNQPVPLFHFYPAVKTEQHTSKVIPKVNSPHLVYPLGVNSVDISGEDDTIEFSLNTNTDKIVTIANGKAEAIGSYSLTFDSPIYSKEKLDAAGKEGLGMDRFENVRLIEKYTQLPSGLPARIGQLAAEITKNEKAWYGKAKAIESYFKSSQFVYSQSGIAVPGEDEDYVDQFLFETQRGYCDNFSTSMVVMLRTLGIPSRWVKGYSDGEYKETKKDGRRIYEITNNNAHSWVEVYLPEIGWMPFEPTQGFSNAVEIETEKKEDNPAKQEQNKENDLKPAAPKKPEMIEDEETGAKKKASFSAAIKKTGSVLRENSKKIILTLLVAAVFATIMYKWRAKWLPGYYILRYKHTKQNKYLEKAYIALLLQLDRYGLKREHGQTLRDYASYVDQFFSSREMRRLTATYEQYLYRGEIHEGMWEGAKKNWEVMIKKAIA